MTDVQSVIDERAAQYGDPLETHKAIAKVWTGILNAAGYDIELNELDVMLMLSGFKLVRAGRNLKQCASVADSCVDAKAYITFLEENA